jgi:hypothetical protein
MIRKAAIPALVVAAALVASARAGDSPRSGPAPGASASAFDVHDITGPHKGEKLCYV